MKPMSTFTQPDQQANRLEQLLNTLGCAYLRRQQYSEAFEKFQQLLELGTDDPSVYKNAATASIGLGFISEQALDLYQEALDRNPEAAELKINLATLFLKNNVDSDFATNVYKAAVDLQPPNAKELRRFLENQSKNGNSANLTRAELEKAVPGVHDSPLRGNELETLWWAGNFDEARAVIEKSSATGPDKSQRLLQLALTRAYQLIYNDEETRNIDVIRLLWHGLGSINPADSLEALRNYLTIRLPLLNSHTEQAAMAEKLDEYDFILGRIPLDDYFNQFDKERDAEYLNLNEFNLERELINTLEKPPGREHRSENLEVEWNGLLFLEIMDRDNPEVLDRLLELFGNHLAAIPNCLLRRVGKGFLCLANNATLLMNTVINLLQNLDKYKSAVRGSDQVALASGMSVGPISIRISQRDNLTAIVKACHVARLAKLMAKNTNSASVFLLHAEEDDLKNLESSGVCLVKLGDMPLLPGHETTSCEVIWKNPLANLENGQEYQIGDFLTRSAITQHNSYATYLGSDVRLGRQVLLKLMNPPGSAKFLQDDRSLQELFDRIRSVGRLNHLHLATLYDMGQQDRVLYFVREYVEGNSLEKTSAQQKSESEWLTILIKIIKALEYADSQGVAHHNLKPGNIWLSEDDEPKIVDFRLPGFSTDFSDSRVLFPAHWRYQAPEILSGEAGDARSDIYSVGIMAYEMLCGTHPYDTAGSIHMPKDILNAQIATLSKQKNSLHTSWNGLVMKAIEGDPGKRFQSFSEMHADLHKLQLELLEKALDYVEEKEPD